MAFADRTDAGRQLAGRLEQLRRQDVAVLALPRGGVPVAAEVAARLGAPLDVLVVRKLGVPFQRELAMGAIGEDGVRVLNEEVLRLVHVSDADLAETESDERAELERRTTRYRRGRPRVQLKGKTAVIVDDGIATGATARAACDVARAHGAERIVLAVPVAPPDTVRALAEVADEVVVVEQPSWLSSIGQWYDDFRQTSDEEVVALLDEAAARQATAEEVLIKAAGAELTGTLTVPSGAIGVVVFAHGSGSGRLSPRNVQVADALQEAGLGTLLFDLLTESEAVDRQNVFDIELLAGRMVGAIGWTRTHQLINALPVGLFGASTGAAAALWASTEPGVEVGAIVSRGGRPDLAATRLPHVSAPTLLIVGSLDDVVLGLNREAQQAMRCETELTIVNGASHLFEEPGALEEVSALAAAWFSRQLTASPQRHG
ncbi:MAG TPA: phosphoribosyltransferase [Jiangellaceae bacterium]|nr:phosphoribosyltransferase [Jiangellaceae bacterium]